MNQPLTGLTHEQQSGNIQRQWDLVTDDDANLIDNNLIGLSEVLQLRYGFSEEEAETEIQAWLCTFRE